MMTSKGVAGVPRASLVVILATLKHFGIPEAGLLLILGIDQFLDMGRSATNVIGNSLAASAVAKFEGDLGPARDEEPAVAPVRAVAVAAVHSAWRRRERRRSRPAPSSAARRAPIAADGYARGGLWPRVSLAR